MLSEESWYLSHSLFSSLPGDDSASILVNLLDLRKKLRFVPEEKVVIEEKSRGSSGDASGSKEENAIEEKEKDEKIVESEGCSEAGATEQKASSMKGKKSGSDTATSTGAAQVSVRSSSCNII
jgi:hypothetical protein